MKARFYLSSDIKITLKSHFWHENAKSGFYVCNIVTGLQIREFNQKLIFLFLNQNMFCGCSKELSQRDGSFEHLKHMFKLITKKIFTIVC